MHAWYLIMQHDRQILTVERVPFSYAWLRRKVSVKKL